MRRHTPRAILLLTLTLATATTVGAAGVGAQERPSQEDGAPQHLAWTPEQEAVIAALSRGPVGIEEDFERWESGFHPDWSFWQMGTVEVRPRDIHMGLVHELIDGGAAVRAFEFTPVDVVVLGDMAMVRANAVETIEHPDGRSQVVRYASMEMLVRVEGRWLVRASSIVFPESGAK